MPQFPGGMEAFLKFMQRNLKQPEDFDEGQKMVVLASFVVDAGGNIVNIAIDQKARPDLDAEVLRVIKKMPVWEPGMQNGRKVPVFYKLPVTFIAGD
jgi:protein TonB